MFKKIFTFQKIFFPFIFGSLTGFFFSQSLKSGNIYSIVLSLVFIFILFLYLFKFWLQSFCKNITNYNYSRRFRMKRLILSLTCFLSAIISAIIIRESTKNSILSLTVYSLFCISYFVLSKIILIEEEKKI